MTIHVATLTALFLLLVDASIHQTTVIINEENPRESDDCRQEMMREENLEQCKEFIMKVIKSEREGIREGRHINPAYEEHFETCCQQLSEMSSMCRCYGLMTAIEQIPRERMMIGPKDFSEVMRTAEDIPDICDLEPNHCQFDSPYKMW